MSTSINPPQWDVIESTPIRELIGMRKGEILDGRGVGGDIHATVDVNPDSPTFGEVHSTLRLPGGFEEHS